MALAFVANSWQLANWGFSAGDIAVLAGAGRNVITWLSAEGRDKNLLDFLSVSPTGLGIRGGLIDTASLNQRWGQTAVLFRNGRRCEFKPGGGKCQIEDNGQFTWIMTIVVSCLDTAVSNTTLMAIVVDFISGIFEDNILDIEYLQYEIPKHVDGWRSTACVRNMPPRARDIWNSLEKEHRHLPGFMPLSEKGEVVRMLLWIVTGKTPRYITASSDAFCLAVLLEEMGFALLRTGSSQHEFDESCIAVVFNDSTFSISPEASPLYLSRYGMRIPLASMEESISLWPGATSNNRRRLIFANGMKASKGIAMFASTLPSIELERGPGIQVIGTDPQSPRSNPDAFRICERYLLVSTTVAIEEIKELIDSWAIHNGAERERIISYLDRRALLETDLEYFGDLQIFLLGYYYAALSTIVDTSRLHLQEVFGSWTWYDLDFLNMLDKLVKTGHRVNGGRYFSRHEIMRLVAYLFGGGEKEQLATISYGVVGVIGKLVVLNRSLLGDADTVDSISKFTLLDIDPTCIPSNGRGLISCARQSSCIPQTAYVADISAFHDINGKDVDFTSQIEPAWGYDTNLCFVSYRYKGRLVHKLNPIQMEASILKYADAGLIDTTATMTRDKVSNPEPQVAQKTQIKNHPASQSVETPVSANSQTSSTLQSRSTRHFESVEAGRFGGIFDSPVPNNRARQVFQGMLHHYHGGNLAWARGINDSPISPTEGNVVLVPTQGLRRARVCILTMYKGHYSEEKGGEKLDEEGKLWRTHFPEALICGVSDWYLVLP